MSSNTNKILELRQFLVMIQDWGVPAVVAGGFLRDYLNDKPIRDIDLYVSCDYFDELYAKLREPHPYEAYNQDTFMFFSRNTDEYDHQMIQCQTEFEGGDTFKTMYPALSDHPINLIGLRNDTEVQAPVHGQSITNYFNLSLSQAWLSAGDQFIRYTPMFRRDIKLRQNTVLRSEWGNEGTIKAVHKFKQKYPDWTITNQDGTLWDERTFIREAYQSTF